MATRMCGNCFAEIADDDVQFCPNCGQRLGEQNPPDALPLGTILDGKYVIGYVLGRDDGCITYGALVYQNRRAVSIREYFPKGLCHRGSNGVMVSATDVAFEARRSAFSQDGATLKDVDARKAGEVLDRFSENNTSYVVMARGDGTRTLPDPKESPAAGSPEPDVPPASLTSEASAGSHEKTYSKSALIALVCGIAGFFFAGAILGSVAFGTGIKAWRETGPDGPYKGRPLAVVGIVLGAIDVAVLYLLNNS